MTKLKKGQRFLFNNREAVKHMFTILCKQSWLLKQGILCLVPFIYLMKPRYEEIYILG